MKTLISFIFLAIAITIGCTSSGSVDIRNSAMHVSLDSLLQATITEGSTPGVAVAVVSGERVLYSKAFGVREVGAEQEVTTADVFNFSSIVKTVTSTAVMQQVERDGLVLDDHATNYLSAIDGDEEDPTIRHMLSHSSGIQFSDQEPSDDGALRPWDLVIANPPGTKLQYSNAAFYTLGKIIEEQEGNSFEDYVDEQIFKALGMNHSSIHSIEGLGDATVPHTIEESELITVDRPEYDPRRVGNGIFYSTIEDMSVWAQLHLSKGTVNGQTMLSASSYDEIWKPNLETGWDEMKAAAGLGWFIGEVDGRRTASHIGGTNGYSAALVIFPDDDRAMVIAGNSNKLPREALIESIAEIIFR